MKIYTVMFTESDGSGLENVGAYFDFEQARSAAEAHAAKRIEEERHGITPGGQQLHWTHFSPRPQRRMYLDMWVGRDSYMNYYLVWRVEAGVRPWEKDKSVAEKFRQGTLVPPVWADMKSLREEEGIEVTVTMD